MLKESSKTVGQSVASERSERSEQTDQGFDAESGSKDAKATQITSNIYLQNNVEKASKSPPTVISKGFKMLKESSKTVVQSVASERA